MRSVLCLIVLVASALEAPTALAQTVTVAIHAVKFVDGQSTNLQGVQIAPKGAGNTSPPTTRDGRTQLVLPSDIKPGETVGVTADVGTLPLILLNDQIQVPKSAHEAVELYFVERGSKELSENPEAINLMMERIVRLEGELRESRNQRDQSDAELRAAVRQEITDTFGIHSEEMQTALANSRDSEMKDLVSRFATILEARPKTSQELSLQVRNEGLTGSRTILGASGGIVWLDKQRSVDVGGEFEAFIPKISSLKLIGSSSLFLSYQFFRRDSAITYTTLPGLEPTLLPGKVDLHSLELGWRKYFYSNWLVMCFGDLSGGMTWQRGQVENNDFVGRVGLGSFLNTSSGFRILLRVEYSRLQLATQHGELNSFGSQDKLVTDITAHNAVGVRVGISYMLPW